MIEVVPDLSPVPVGNMLISSYCKPRLLLVRAVSLLLHSKLESRVRAESLALR